MQLPTMQFTPTFEKAGNIAKWLPLLGVDWAWPGFRFGTHTGWGLQRSGGEAGRGPAATALGPQGAACGGTGGTR